MPVSARLRSAMDLLSRATAPLALAVTLLLCLQWPLRDAVAAGATQANDLAQWLFALYVAVAVRHAGRRGAHLVARPDLAGADGRGGALRRLGAALCVLPWSLFVALSAWPMVRASVRGLERFPETADPGYFLVKAALLLLAALLALQSLLDCADALADWRRAKAA